MFTKHILKYCARSRTVFTRSRSYCQLAGIKEWLQSYPGGSVDLQQDNESGIAVITLNHAEMKNAMSGKMMADFADVTDTLQTWKEGKGAIIQGAGDSFCSGGNLSFVKEILSTESGGKMSLFMQETLYRFFNLPIVSVALLNGRALGGGAEIATACDFRLVTPKSSVGFVQSRMGVSPGFGGGNRLVQLVGRTDALELLTTGNILSPDELLHFGLANGIVPEENALAEAEKWLGKRTHASPDVVRAAKGVVVNAVNSRDSKTGLDSERACFKSVWGGPTHIQAMNLKVKHR